MQFSMQLLHCTPVFSTFGMFPLDGTLLFTVSIILLNIIIRIEMNCLLQIGVWSYNNLPDYSNPIHTSL